MIEGGDQVIRNMKKLGVDVDKLAADAINATALAVQRDAIRLVSQPGRGRTYQLGPNPTRVHRASAPGDPPAKDQGGLMSSIEPTLTTPARLIAQVGVLATIAYARRLEHGDQGAGLQPRPFMFPAMEGRRDDLRKNMMKLFHARVGK